MKKMKIGLILAIGLLFAVLPLVGCRGEPKLHPDSDPSINPRLENQIRRSWVRSQENHDRLTFEHIFVWLYYGTFEGSSVLEVNISFLTVDAHDNIAGLEFLYRGMNPIRVWRNGIFYSLQEAYGQGLLTIEHLEQVSYIGEGVFDGLAANVFRIRWYYNERVITNDFNGFLGQVVIPHGATGIRQRAFEGAGRLHSVTIEGHINNIGWGAFWGRLLCAR